MCFRLIAIPGISVYTIFTSCYYDRICYNSGILHATVYSNETMCTPLYESWLLDWINHIPPTLSLTLKILPLAGQTSLGRISGPYPLSQCPLRCTVAGFWGNT